MSELPAGWFPVKLGEVTEFKYGKALPAAVRDGGEFPVFGSNGVVGYHSTWISPAPTIVIGRKGSVGEVCFSEKNCSPIDTTYYVDLFEFFEPKFCFYLLKTLRLGGLNKSTAIPGLNRQDAYDLEIGLPPLAEQTRIAAKLDELLAQVDTLKARIDSIPALLKRFRQSVLAAAVSGRLTEEWRVGRAAQATEEESTLPGWTQTVFGEICREITVGYVGKMADQYREEGVPFLRSQNVRPMRFSPENILYISEEFHSSIFKSRLEPGDLAVVRSGAPGVTCVIPESLPIANCSDLVIARPSERLNSWFGCIYMNSEVAQRNVADNQVGVAQQHFNVGSMKKMPINLPPLEEQTEIVRRVEQLFAFADQLEAKVNEARTRIDRLTQSILAKAFRGELVPQDPNDEPASVLLERIQAQRASAPKARRTRKT